jgi:DNA-binding beta-propeller fold protein YncE
MQFPRAIAVDPNSKFAYVIGGPVVGPGWIESFRIAGATPEPIVQLPAGDFPQSVVVDPSDKFVYVTDDIGNVLMYEITPGTGELKGPTTISTGIPGAVLRGITLVTVQLP